ncbi:hypothetical protein [Williamsia muralis]|uniref:hypothetical protein n=2 Tax=Williamsia marianensis TaxID=85044 RepID=UPI000A7F040A|nr:hypothetical protein [Williamsia muralis]PVY27149.1 hypothetical protein C7458_11236 [Williamsia marianensis]
MSGSVNVPAWSRLVHLGAHETPEPRPELAELGMDAVHEACIYAWKYSRADFEPHLDVERKRSQWRETCALAGSMAESLMLGSAAVVEAEWHARAIAAGTESAGMALAQRYLADTAVDTVVSIGHRLINFLVRVARTDPATCRTLADVSWFEAFGPTYLPFETDDPAAWLPLNEKTINSLRRVLPARHAPSLDALDVLVRSDAWKAVFEIRGENFHRWRKEHESVIGVDANSGAETDLYNDEGNHIGRSIGGFSRRHTISDGLTARTTAVAGDGLRAVAVALDALIADALQVLPEIADGYTITFTATHIEYGRQTYRTTF